ncbi:MAG: iron chelate uptake ABC transporter family permease subunit [Pirellulaceae bacterium]
MAERMGGGVCFPLSTLPWIWEYDGWVVLAGALFAIAAALPGTFLVLRRMSLAADAISHAVLPGIVLAYWWSGGRQAIAMLLGAACLGLATIWLTDRARSLGKVDEGAATGTVFTGLFAAGLILMVQLADSVDLDPGCLLFGDLEMVPIDAGSSGWRRVPTAIWIAAALLVANLSWIVLFWKELKVSSFDEAYAESQGLAPAVAQYALATSVAITAVASFQAVGNLLVVGMFIIPPAAAMLLSHRLPSILLIAAGVAAVSAAVGHWLAIELPSRLQLPGTSTAGMMVVVACLILAGAILLSPIDGWLARWLRTVRHRRKVEEEDLLARIYRQQETSRRRPQPHSTPSPHPLSTRILRRLERQGLVEPLLDPPQWQLTASGMARAKELVRSHRLWETFLDTHPGVSPDRLHERAEALEHFTDLEIRRKLEEQTDGRARDPHGSPIPEEPGPER